MEQNALLSFAKHHDVPVLLDGSSKKLSGRDPPPIMATVCSETSEMQNFISKPAILRLCQWRGIKIYGLLLPIKRMLIAIQRWWPRPIKLCLARPSGSEQLDPTRTLAGRQDTHWQCERALPTPPSPSYANVNVLLELRSQYFHAVNSAWSQSVRHAVRVSPPNRHWQPEDRSLAT
jgi:hypothetical protein